MNVGVLFRGAGIVLGVAMVVSWVSAQESAYTALSSNPEEVVVMGDWLYFSANDGRYGTELWRADVNGRTERIMDITRGPEGSDLYAFEPFNGVLYFGYRPKGGVGQLWRSDGTQSGTYPVSTCEDNGKPLPFSQLVAHTATHFFFTTGQGRSNRMLWVSDGTAQGTQLVRTARPEYFAQFSTFHGDVVGERLYLNINWNAKHAVAYVEPGEARAYVIRVFESEANSFFRLDSETVLFRGFEKETGGELWRTSESPESCVQIVDIYPGEESSNVGEMHRLESEPTGVMILFAATDLVHGRELWTTDGTKEGTHIWKDVLDGAASSNPYRLISGGGLLFFAAIGGKIGNEMWCYNTGTDKLFPISDINPELGGSGPYATCLTATSTLYFSAHDQSYDEELYVYSGGEKLATRVADIFPGEESSTPTYTTVLAGALITVAEDPVHGRELRIHRTNSEVKILADIWSDNSVNPSSFPGQFTEFQGRLYFVANDLKHGNELWSTDGTAAGTYRVKDIMEGRESSNPSQLTAVGEFLYFVADDGLRGYELWRTDGTTSGTTHFLDVNHEGSSHIGELTVFKDNLIFRARRKREGAELWIVRPGRSGEVLKDINGGAGSSNPRELVVWDGYLYFQADDGVNGAEFWRSDGTEEGTQMVKDIVGIPVEKISASEAYPAFGQLFIAAEVNGAGAEVWSLKKNATELHAVRDIASPSAFNVLNPAYPSAP